MVTKSVGLLEDFILFYVLVTVVDPIAPSYIKNTGDVLELQCNARFLDDLFPERLKDVTWL